MKSEPFILTTALFLRVLMGLLVTSLLAIYLVPDEAQYFLWSQYLGLSYYSKPAGIAYQIAFSTLLAGNSEGGVRFISVIISALIGFVLYRIARNLRFNKQISLYASLIFCFSPIGLLGSFAATTDGGMLLFALLAFNAIVKRPNWPLFGLFIMLSGLFKWTGYLMWLPAFLGVILYPQWRKKSLVMGILISLLALVPSLLWNAERGWPSFLHVFYQITPLQKAQPNPIAFFGSQILLLFPVPFYYFLKTFLRSVKRPKPFAVAFPSYIAALILAIFTGLAFFEKVQANWAILFMPFASLAAASMGSLRILKISLIISTGMSLVMLLVPLLEKHQRTAIPYRYNLFKDAMGWDHLRALLKKESEHDFFFSNTYQMASILSYYGPSRAYMLNIDGRRQSHFTYMPSMTEEQKNKNGLYVRLEEKPFDHESVVLRVYRQLAPYFQSVSFKGEYPIFSTKNKPVKWVLLFDCQAYNGLEPEKSIIY
ncbi:MAG: glycosyltransferase family 39 protein [Chlamydiae bacterium]|nr:glycosyltransferase family 39 protein [Chlamydiota bacterium]